MNPDVLTATADSVHQSMALDEIAFLFTNNSAVVSVLEYNPDAKMGFIPVFAYHPDGPRFLIGGERNAVGIAFNTPYEEECLLFLEFLTQPENVRLISEAQGLPPALKGIENDLGPLTEDYQRWQGLPIVPYFDRAYLPSGMWSVLQNVGAGVVSGEYTPSEGSKIRGELPSSAGREPVTQDDQNLEYCRFLGGNTQAFRRGGAAVRKKHVHMYLMLIPVVILFTGLVFYPFIEGIRISLTNWNGYSRTYSYVGMTNYISLLNSRLFKVALRNTFIYGFGCTFIQQVVGLAYALFVNLRFRGRNLVRLIIYLPSMIAGIIMGYMMYGLFEYNRRLNDIVRWLGGQKVLWLEDGNRPFHYRADQCLSVCRRLHAHLPGRSAEHPCSDNGGCQAGWLWILAALRPWSFPCSYRLLRPVPSSILSVACACLT